MDEIITVLTEGEGSMGVIAEVAELLGLKNGQVVPAVMAHTITLASLDYCKKKRREQEPKLNEKP